MSPPSSANANPPRRPAVRTPAPSARAARRILVISSPFSTLLRPEETVVVHVHVVQPVRAEGQDGHDQGHQGDRPSGTQAAVVLVLPEPAPLVSHRVCLRLDVLGGATASAQRARPARRPVLLDRLALDERSELRARPRDLRVKTRLLTLECGEALSR